MSCVRACVRACVCVCVCVVQPSRLGCFLKFNLSAFLTTRPDYGGVDGKLMSENRASGHWWWVQAQQACSGTLCTFCLLACG